MVTRRRRTRPRPLVDGWWKRLAWVGAVSVLVLSACTGDDPRGATSSASVAASLTAVGHPGRDEPPRTRPSSLSQWSPLSHPERLLSRVGPSLFPTRRWLLRWCASRSAARRV